MICRHHFLMTLRFTLFLLMYLAGRATAAQVLSRTIGCGFGHLVRGDRARVRSLLQGPGRHYLRDEDDLVGTVRRAEAVVKCENVFVLELLQNFHFLVDLLLLLLAHPVHCDAAPRHLNALLLIVGFVHVLERPRAESLVELKKIRVP